MFKKLFFTLAFLGNFIVYSQELKYKEYSYSEFFKMIVEEKDSVFKLSDAIITFDINADSIYAGKANLNNRVIDYFRKDTIVINKNIELDNVQLIPFYISEKLFNEGINEFFFSGINHFKFKKPVSLKNTIALNLEHSSFEEPVSFTTNSEIYNIYDYFEKFINKEEIGFFSNISYSDITLKNLEFKKGLNVYYNIYYKKRNLSKLNWVIANTIIKNKPDTDVDLMYFRNINSVDINATNFEPNYSIISYRNNSFNLEDSYFFEKLYLSLSANENFRALRILNNTFNKDVLVRAFDLYKDMEIDWLQWKNKIVNNDSWQDHRFDIIEDLNNKDVNPIKLRNFTQSDSIYEIFKNKYFLKTDKSLKDEYKLRAQFLKFYRDNYEFDNANLVYLEFKDLETKKSEIEYKNNPTFDNFFSWRINQFLNVFSAYGTKPSKAVTFSFYVILFFAFIYLLFPNSWDSLGKKRIMHRFEFFQKYLRRKEGMHTLYLEDKKQEIATFEDFKTNLEKAHLELPSFFISWSKPLYNASMFSSRITSRFLKMTDVLQGKWQDLSPKQKRWKNFQIGLLLTVGLFYDLFIKVLNALMLSINTFTTLGFGEIPIKGLPRYLAIIQGFIGWFMLTIFSVSLISQLLN